MVHARVHFSFIETLCFLTQSPLWLEIAAIARADLSFPTLYRSAVTLQASGFLLDILGILH